MRVSWRQNPPTIIRAKFEGDPKKYIRVEQGEDGSAVISFVDKQSIAAKFGVTVGCEILAVNGQKVYGASDCLRKLVSCTKASNGGKVDVMISKGHRGKGYKYILIEKFDNNMIDPSSDVIDGLTLEETNDVVKIRRTPHVSSSNFHGHRLNEGDVICTISGIPINSIVWAKVALKVASGPLIPILTFNIWRKVKLMLLPFIRKGKKLSIFDGASTVPNMRIEDQFDIHAKLKNFPGSPATVYKATLKTTGKTYAVKSIDRKKLTVTMDASVQSEIAILKKMKHDNIVGLEKEIVTITHYYLVTEYYEGSSLFEEIQKQESFTEADARDVCKAVLHALKFMHSKGVVHRDLKPEYIMLQDEGDFNSAKIGGFRFAKAAPNDHSLRTLCGTQGFIAPEVLRRLRYGSKADMWSIGVTFFYMILSRKPFVANTEQELQRISKAGDFSFGETNFTKGAKEVIESLLVTEPTKRASAEEVLSHPWMEEKRMILGGIVLDWKRLPQSVLAERRKK